MGKYRQYLTERKKILKIMMMESIKGNIKVPPIFKMIDFPNDRGLDEHEVMADLEKRGFKLDRDRDQRMVTEFFTGILPEVCYIIFAEQWQKHFGLSREQLNQYYDRAMTMTHIEHYKHKDMK